MNRTIRLLSFLLLISSSLPAAKPAKNVENPDFTKGDEIEVDVTADGSKLEFRVPASSPKA